MALAEVRLADRYAPGPAIGADRLCDLYAGRDLLLHRPVAIKVLHAELASDPDFLERFDHAVRSAAKFGHPGATAIFDIGGAGGARYLVTELVEGRNLADVLRRGPGLAAAEAVRVMRAVAEVVGAAHERGLVHGGLEPAAITIADDGQVKVAGFGIAAVHTVVGPAGAVPASPRADLDALGACLYECLAGRPPLAAPVPLERLRPELPASLARVTARALSADPAERYRYAAELAEDLRVAIALPTGPRPPVVPVAHLGPASPGAQAEARPGAGRRPPAVLDERPAAGRARGRGRRWLGPAAILAVVTLAAMTGAWLMVGRGPGGNDAQAGTGQIVVPPVRDLPAAAATALLERKGLRVTPARQAHADIAAGHAIETEPGSGGELRPGQVVLLLVSSGPATGPVPGVEGTQGGQAAAKLVAAGYPTSIVQETSQRPAGTVLRQDPPAGRKLTPGHKVVLTVATPPPGPGPTTTVTTSPGPGPTTTTVGHGGGGNGTDCFTCETTTTVTTTTPTTEPPTTVTLGSTTTGAGVPAPVVTPTR